MIYYFHAYKNFPNTYLYYNELRDTYRVLSWAEYLGMAFENSACFNEGRITEITLVPSATQSYIHIDMDKLQKDDWLLYDRTYQILNDLHKLHKEVKYIAVETWIKEIHEWISARTPFHRSVYQDDASAETPKTQGE